MKIVLPCSSSVPPQPFIPDTGPEARRFVMAASRAGRKRHASKVLPIDRFNVNVLGLFLSRSTDFPACFKYLTPRQRDELSRSIVASSSFLIHVVCSDPSPGADPAAVISQAASAAALPGVSSPEYGAWCYSQLTMILNAKLASTTVSRILHESQRNAVQRCYNLLLAPLRDTPPQRINTLHAQQLQRLLFGASSVLDALYARCEDHQLQPLQVTLELLLQWCESSDWAAQLQPIVDRAVAAIRVVASGQPVIAHRLAEEQAANELKDHWQQARGMVRDERPEQRTAWNQLLACAVLALSHERHALNRPLTAHALGVLHANPLLVASAACTLAAAICCYGADGRAHVRDVAATSARRRTNLHVRDSLLPIASAVTCRWVFAEHAGYPRKVATLIEDLIGELLAREATPAAYSPGGGEHHSIASEAAIVPLADEEDGNLALDLPTTVVTAAAAGAELTRRAASAQRRSRRAGTGQPQNGIDQR